MGGIGAVWGILGLSLLLGRGLACLVPYVLELSEFSMLWYHNISFAGCVIGLGYAEGYKGFHLRFSPRVAARALYILRNPSPMHVLFAPLFCMGFFHATCARKIVAFSLTGMVVGLIFLVGKLSQPWRGIIDAGVLLGLGWGLVSVWYYSYQAFFGKSFNINPETPHSKPEEIPDGQNTKKAGQTEV